MLEKAQIISFVILVILIVAIILWLYLTIRSIRFSKRIENYVLMKEDIENLSILDKFFRFYDDMINRWVRKLKKTKINQFYYQKNHNQTDTNQELRKLIVKTLSCLSFTVIYLLSSFIGIVHFSKIITILILLIGFYIPDIFFSIRKKLIRKQMESDLIKAISLMNNSFQSGKSTIQAIQTVSRELEGPLALEFDKIYQDLLHGLSFQTAFTRFQDRVELEEVEYITAALTILNKTGGNIIEVFSSIEKSFYTRRKLDTELKATIASSRLVFQLLVFLPIFLWAVIGLWNPNYFSSFFESTLGTLLFFIILSIYLIYILIIRSIMKVEKC